MKTIAAIVLFFSLNTHAFQSCLTGDEALKLHTIKTALTVEKEINPNCVNLRGAGACLDPSSEFILEVLKEKAKIDYYHIALIKIRAANSSCSNYRGAIGCLSPYDQSVLDSLYDKYPKCKNL